LEIIQHKEDTMRIIGTCYFDDYRAATKYYRDYEPFASEDDLREIIKRKIGEGLISVACPFTPHYCYKGLSGRWYIVEIMEEENEKVVA
jgi:hypothetical protein